MAAEEGRITNVPWCVKFQNYEGCRHPSQIYEAIKNLFMFSVLWLVYDLKTKGKKLPSGFLFWLFVVMYSVLRFFIEFFRMPDEQLGFIAFGLTMGQILNIAMFLIGIFFLIKVIRKK